MELLGVQSSSGDSKEVEQIIVSTMEREPDLAGIFVACMGQSGVSAAFDRMKPGKRPYVIVYDLTLENVEALKKAILILSWIRRGICRDTGRSGGCMST